MSVAAPPSEAKSQTYNLAGTEPIAVLDIAQGIERLLGGVTHQLTPARPGDFSGRAGDTSKVARALDWRPKTPLCEGLRETLVWYLAPHPGYQAALAPAAGWMPDNGR